MNFRSPRPGISIKLMLATFALLVGALASLAWSTYQSSVQMVTSSQHALMNDLLRHTDRSLFQIQEQLGTLLLSVAANKQIWAMSNSQVEAMLETYVAYNPLAGGLYLIRDNGEMVGVPRPYVRALGHLVAPEVQSRFGDQATGLVWTEPYLSPLSHWTVTVGMRVLLDDGSSPGIVAMDVPLLSLMKNALPTLSFEGASTLLVVTDEQALVIADHTNPLLGYRLSTNRLHTSPEVIEQVFAAPAGQIEEIAIDNTPYSLLAGSATPYGWRPILLFSNQGIEQGRLTVARTSSGLLILVGLVSLGLAWFVARNFARPLERLTREMSRVQKGRLEGIRLPPREDEIGELAVAFDQMMARIRALVDELHESERAKKDTEIRLLQAQIKPHFLYNTLNAIGHSAALGRTEDVYDMIQSLTRVLSFAFDNLADKVMLAEELAFLEHYIRLQRIRYGRAFQVVYAVEPGVGRCRVLKLSLQPLVENAILHGLSQRPEGGILQIAARRRDDRLELQVIDNGPGIDPARLQTLAEQSDGGLSHMGLRNVRERLALHYGADAALEIAPVNASPTGTGNGTGTRVTIWLPVEWETTPAPLPAASEDSFLELAQQWQAGSLPPTTAAQGA